MNGDLAFVNVSKTPGDPRQEADDDREGSHEGSDEGGDKGGGREEAFRQDEEERGPRRLAGEAMLKAWPST